MIPEEWDRMPIHVRVQGTIEYTTILLKKIEYADPLTHTKLWTIWTPLEEREYSKDEIEAMELHCRRSGVHFELRPPI